VRRIAANLGAAAIADDVWQLAEDLEQDAAKAETAVDFQGWCDQFDRRRAG
jgi:hypothetical protein